MFNNLKIAQKLTGAFLMILVLTAFVGYLGFKGNVFEAEGINTFIFI